MKKSNKNTKGIDRKGMPLVKNANGITLIALVVTIVVLLILAGITINMLFSENGIITKAREAADKTAQAEENETAGMQNMVDQMDDILNSMNSDGNTLIAMYNAGLACENPDTCTDESHLHIGDYVNYTEPTSGSYTVTAAKSGATYDQTYTLSETKNNVNWRVLGIDETTGGLKLIADSPIKTDITPNDTDVHLYLKGAQAYVYGPDEMNNICAMYANGLAQEARSMTMADIDAITKVTTDAQKEAVNYWTAVVDASPLGTAYSFTEQYTPESYLGISPYTEAKTETTVSGTTTGYAYIIVQTEEEKAAIEAGKITPVMLTNTRVYNMLFGGAEYETGKAYWLASRGVVACSDFAGFGPGVAGIGDGVARAFSCGNCFNSAGGVSGDSLAVRPVVCLKSSVTKNDIQKIADQPDSWVTE